jgi:hypothetical protein
VEGRTEQEPAAVTDAEQRGERHAPPPADDRADRDARDQAIDSEQEKTHFDLPVQREQFSGNPGSEDFPAA